MKYQKNQVLRANIAETNMLGFGVVKIDGAVIFVQNAVEGDVCEIKIIKCSKNYYIARIEKIISPSVHRIENACKHFHRCGGCAFQHVSYEHEKDLKRKSVEGFLKKEGLSDVAVLPVLSTQVMTHYRNKAQFPVALAEDGKVICGFYAPKTHKVCPLDECSIQNPIFVKIAKRVCDFLTKYKIAPYDEQTQKGLVRHVYLRIAQATGQIMLCLVLKEREFAFEKEFVSEILRDFPSISSICLNVQPECNNVILGSETILLYGAEKITDLFCERKLNISPLSFYQVNHDAAELLYQTGFSMANLKNYDHLIDLYCGIGSISISSHCSCPIVGVEIIPEAVSDACENASLNGINNAAFICGDASDAFRHVSEIGAKNPLLIVDPPRKGLTRDLIEDISRHNIKTVLYISCSPDTFARDLAMFRKEGYLVSEVQPVDLFPRTSHVENIAVLHREVGFHRMHLNAKPFELIKSGEKTIELRLNDEKRRHLQINDVICFTHAETGEELYVKVVRLHYFDSFDDLYKSIPLLKCGYNESNLSEAKSEDMLQFYSADEQNKFGVVGIEISMTMGEM